MQHCMVLLTTQIKPTPIFLQCLNEDIGVAGVGGGAHGGHDPLLIGEYTKIKREGDWSIPLLHTPNNEN